jgi:nitrogen fixation protein NifU and related proteins
MAALYSEVLLDHFRRPRNYGTLPAPDIAYEDLNPLCGDRIRIELRVNQTVVEDARFTGNGCAISMAAASLLTELIMGSDIKDTEAISDDDLIAALESDIKPSRRQCALLPLEVLRAGLRNNRIQNSN